MANAQADGDDILLPPLAAPPSCFTRSETYTSGRHIDRLGEGPQPPQATDTVLFMYYGNGSATSQQNATGVWDANYARSTT